jgi:hypothetical protein
MLYQLCQQRDSLFVLLSDLSELERLTFEGVRRYFDERSTQKGLKEFIPTEVQVSMFLNFLFTFYVEFLIALTCKY